MKKFDPNSIRTTAPRSQQWLVTFATNAWIPVAIFCMYLTGRRFEFSGIDSYKITIAMYVGINIILAVSLQLINGISGQFSLGHAGFMAVGAYMAGYAVKAYANFPNKDNPEDSNSDYYNPAAVLLFFVALGIALSFAAAVVYAIFSLIRSSRFIHSSIPGFLLVIIFGWFIADIAHGLGNQNPPNYLVFSNLIQLDHRIFDQIINGGTHAAESLSTSLPIGSRKPATMVIGLLGGGVLAGAAGLIVGLPTLRLRGDYLAIATLGFGEIIRVVIVNCAPLGGATGLQAPTYAMQPDADSQIAGYYISPWIYAVVLITIVVVQRIKSSPKGRALRALREDEIAAAAIGINTTHHKVIAFVMGAFLAGVAGGLFVNLNGYLNTNSFGFMRSIEIVVMVTLGGLGSIWGTVIAAVVLTLIPYVLDNVSPTIAQYRLVIYSLLLIGLMLLRSTTMWSRLSWRRPKLRAA